MHRKDRGYHIENKNSNIDHSQIIKTPKIEVTATKRRVTNEGGNELELLAAWTGPAPVVAVELLDVVMLGLCVLELAPTLALTLEPDEKPTAPGRLVADADVGVLEIATGAVFLFGAAWLVVCTLAAGGVELVTVALTSGNGTTLAVLVALTSDCGFCALQKFTKGANSGSTYVCNVPFVLSPFAATQFWQDA